MIARNAPASKIIMPNVATDQRVPISLERALYVLLGGIVLVSLVMFSSRPPVSPTVILDVWLVLLWVGLTIRGRTDCWKAAWIFSAILGIVLILAITGGSPIYDVVQAYRWIVYIVILATAVGRIWSDVKSIILLTWFLIGAAIIKYALLLALGITTRPTLLIENNFELALFSGLGAVIYKHISPRQRILLITSVALIVVMSGSRSGAASFVILVIYAIFSVDIKTIFARYILIWAVPLAGVFALGIFEDRTSSVQSIDRVTFFNVFLEDTSNRHALNWLVGNFPITPMSPGACQELSFYQGLFSSAGDGSCYSVILHSFVLRVVYDAGLIGLAVSILAPIFLMKRAGVSLSLILVLTGIALANGLSVSGINNPYVFLPILFSVLLAHSVSRQPGAASHSVRTIAPQEVT